MVKPNAKPSLGTRTLDFGSSFAAGAMMLSRMNRSELTRYDDLVSDLCCLPNPAQRRRDPYPPPLNPRRR
jgi:hypothetical protein